MAFVKLTTIKVHSHDVHWRLESAKDSCVFAKIGDVLLFLTTTVRCRIMHQMHIFIIANLTKATEDYDSYWVVSLPK